MELNLDEMYCLAINGNPHFLKGSKVKGFLEWTQERFPEATYRLFELVEDTEFPLYKQSFS